METLLSPLIIFCPSLFLSQCRILLSPRWTWLFSAEASSQASESESISPLFVCVCPPSFYIPYFSIICPKTPDWRFRKRPVAPWRSPRHTLWIWHVQPITPSTEFVHVASCREKHRGRAHTDVHGRLMHMEAVIPQPSPPKHRGRYVN